MIAFFELYQYGELISVSAQEFDNLDEILDLMAWFCGGFILMYSTDGRLEYVGNNDDSIVVLYEKLS